MLLAAGSVASLAANVAVAEPTLVGRVMAAWPSFALTASYELLTRQVRRSAADIGTQDQRARQSQRRRPAKAGRTPTGGLTLVSQHQRDGKLSDDYRTGGPAPTYSGISAGT